MKFSIYQNTLFVHVKDIGKIGIKLYLTADSRCLYSILYMFKRTFLCLLYASAIISTPLYGEENLLFQFGPKSESELLITAQDQKNSISVQQIYEIARYLEANPPQIHITLAITTEDFSILPKNFQPEKPLGTSTLIESLSGSKSSPVILLQPNTNDTPHIINGSLKNTSPRWLLETMCNFFEKSGKEYQFTQKRTPLYRLGWHKENSSLGLWLKEGFPAIAIEGKIDIPQFISHIETEFPSGFPQDTDLHYLVFNFKKGTYFLGEGILVLIGVIASAAILFSIFFLGFLFGKRSEQNLRDFFHVWWIPFLFLIINVLALFAGQGLSFFLFRLRFTNIKAWTLLPQIALLAKLIFSWFIFSLIVSLNQLIRLPEDDFIYGYMAYLVCMVSIFIFSSIDFSLSLYFLFVYLIVYLTSHTKKIFFQFLAIILITLPALPYLKALAQADSAIILPLLKGENFWNFNISFFIMPYQLILTRIFHISGRMGFKNKAHFPINVGLTLLGSITISALILFIPAWSKDQPIIISIRQMINSSGSSIILDAPTIPDGVSPEFDQIENTIEYTPEELIPCSAIINTFLERQLVQLDINPAVPPARIDITIQTDEGFSIYDASIPFTLSNGGNTAHFRSKENPSIPFIINFSTDIKTRLVADIQVLSVKNPLGLRILHEGIKTTYLLDVQRTFNLPPPQNKTVNELFE